MVRAGAMHIRCENDALRSLAINVSRKVCMLARVSLVSCTSVTPDTTVLINIDLGNPSYAELLYDLRE